LRSFRRVGKAWDGTTRGHDGKSYRAGLYTRISRGGSCCGYKIVQHLGWRGKQFRIEKRVDSIMRKEERRE
jgi:hypothetical protein